MRVLRARLLAAAQEEADADGLGRRAAARCAPSTAPSGSAPTTSRRTGSPTTGSATRPTTSTRCSTATSTPVHRRARRARTPAELLAAGDAERARRWLGDAAARGSADGRRRVAPRATPSCCAAHVLGVPARPAADAGRRRRRRRRRGSRTLRRPAGRPGAAAAPHRHARRFRYLELAVGPGRLRAAAGDRAARRLGARRGCAGRPAAGGGRPVHRARARSRWRSRTSCPARRGARGRARPRRASTWAAAQRRRPRRGRRHPGRRAGGDMTDPALLRRARRHRRPRRLPTRRTCPTARRVAPRGRRPRPAAGAVRRRRTAWTSSAGCWSPPPGCCGPGGWLVIEHADPQGSALPALLAAPAAGTDVADHRDLAGRPRFATARRPVRDGRDGDCCGVAVRLRLRDPDRARGRPRPPPRPRSGRGELVVLPDRHRLRHRRRRVHAGRRRPRCWRPRAAAGTCRVPVLVGSPRTLDGLVAACRRRRPRPGRGVLAGRADPGRGARAVAGVGPRATPSGTVAVRMPLHPVALELLRRHRPDGGVQRQPLRPPGRHDRARGRRPARRRASPSTSTAGRAARPCRQHDRRLHRADAAGAAASGRSASTGCARSRRTSTRLTRALAARPVDRRGAEARCTVRCGHAAAARASHPR